MQASQWLVTPGPAALHRAAIPKSRRQQLSWIQAIEHSRIRDGLAHVLQTADPCDAPLDAHAEPTVRHRAEAAEIEIPLKGFHWKVVLFYSLHEQVVVVESLPSADDFAVAFGCE